MEIITENIDLWTSTVRQKNTVGRGKSNKEELYGIKKLRDMILELSIRGLLVPQDPKDEPASELLNRIDRKKNQLLKDGKIKKSKSSRSGTQNESPYTLQNGWEWTSFQNLSLGYHIGLDRGKKQQGSNLPFRYFKMNNIRNHGGLDLSETVTVEANQEELKKFTLKSGDFLFVTIQHLFPGSPGLRTIAAHISPCTLPNIVTCIVRA